MVGRPTFCHLTSSASSASAVSKSSFCSANRNRLDECALLSTAGTVDVWSVMASSQSLELVVSLALPGGCGRVVRCASRWWPDPIPGTRFPRIALCLKFLAAGDEPTLLTGTQWLDTARAAGVDAVELVGLDPDDGDDDADSGAKLHRRAARMAVLNAPVLAGPDSRSGGLRRHHRLRRDGRGDCSACRGWS